MLLNITDLANNIEFNTLFDTIIIVPLTLLKIIKFCGKTGNLFYSRLL